MKNLKKIIVAAAMSMIMSVSAFAASGFEAIINVPIGLGVGIPPKTIKQTGFKSGVGFDIGVAAQLGYMFQVKDGFGISVLGELGYAYDTVAFSMKESGYSMSTSTGFHSFQLGLLPKFNIGAFAIGIGGGVKIPVSATGRTKISGDGYSSDEKVKYSSSEIKYIIEPAVIGYIKGTFDYSIFFTDNIAMNVGLYLGYDILKSPKTAYTEAESFGSFDVGVELGVKFGPKA